MEILYTDKLSKQDSDIMTAGLIRYEQEKNITINYQEFALMLIEQNKNMPTKTFGVLNAYTAFQEVCIVDFWIDESVRGKGYGRKLIQALESRFHNTEYLNINLITNAFQAPEFYEKCGFKLEFIRENKTNSALNKYFFVKYFQDFQK